MDKTILTGFSYDHCENCIVYVDIKYIFTSYNNIFYELIV